MYTKLILFTANGNSSPHQHSKQELIKRPSNTFATQFSILLAEVGSLLDSKCSDKLEKCKQFCCTLKVSDECNELLFDNKQLKNINQCCTFQQLFSSQLCLHLNWEDCFILESIVALSELKEAEDELDKYKKHMASKIGMKIISDTFSMDDLPPNSIRLLVIVNKPYTKLTAKEYIELKDFIFTTLEINSGTYHSRCKDIKKNFTYGYAAKHMIKMATSLNEKLSIENSVASITVGNEFLFDCTAPQVRLCIYTCIGCKHIIIMVPISFWQ